MTEELDKIILDQLAHSNMLASSVNLRNTLNLIPTPNLMYLATYWLNQCTNKNHPKEIQIALGLAGGLAYEALRSRGQS